MTRALVTGASGFIGNHLVKYLRDQGYWVRGVDWQPQKEWSYPIDDFRQLDLRHDGSTFQAFDGGIDEVYALAADMGGMGFISTNHIDIMQNNSRINLNTVQAAHQYQVKKYFYASSACAYPEYKQLSDQEVIPLKESDAFPADPQDGYGWEKLFIEVLDGYYRKERGMYVRIARFHNIAGPLGTWKGGREKAPAAICRKVATAKLTKSDIIDVWGNGKAVRSYCYINDCLKGIDKIMHTDHPKLDETAINLGSNEAITVNDLVKLVSDIAKHQVEINHVRGPIGVAGRNSDNTLIQEVLGWQPELKLVDWIPTLYQWVEDQVREDLKIGK